MCLEIDGRTRGHTKLVKEILVLAPGSVVEIGQLAQAVDIL